ncbi:MAG TPA: HYR domain-containing protein, partial [Pyrinomonadaceae bacterium]|nr:HYR domain-containing protein [Pyrinomonadaceae bacterium]
MKNQTAHFNALKRRYVLISLMALFVVSTLVAVPVYSARNEKLKRGSVDKPSTSKSDSRSRRTAARNSSSASTAPTSPETIATFAGDCSTAKSTFYVGETVCARTNSVTLPPTDQWWVNWILLDNGPTVVSGGQGVTNVTTNPQTFTYVPSVAGSYKVSLTNLPNDISQTPAGFAVVPAPLLSTYTGDCTTAKTDFNLAQTVCVKVSGLSNEEFPQRRLQLAEPDGFVLQSFNITDNSQQFTYNLPAASTGTFAGVTIDHRGTWVAALVDPDSDLRVTTPIVVHKSNLFVDRVADLQVAKFLIDTGDPPTVDTDITFQIFVINQGPDPATALTVLDTTLPNTTFVSFNRVAGALGLNRFVDSQIAEFDSRLLNPSMVKFLRDTGSEYFLEDSPAVFNCVTPSAGSAGTTTCTADREIAPGETAEFTAVYHVNANLANGAQLSDPTSVVVRSDTEDQHTASNSTDITIGAGNPAPPACSLACPGNMTVVADTTGQDFNGDTVQGANVTFSANATGATCGTLTATPASGSFFPLGTTPVSIVSADGATCDFLVTVVSSGSAVTISCPANVSANAGPNCNAVVSLSNPPTTGDSVTVTGTRSDGKALSAPYATGVTTVHWVASNSSGSDSCDQLVTVVDVTPPTIVVPTPAAASADANCQSVIPDLRPTASVSDNCGCSSFITDENNPTDPGCGAREPIIVTQSPAPGTPVGLGPHTITLSANDQSDNNNGAGNTASIQVTFTVVDTTPPVFTFVPPAITAYTGAGATTCDTVVDPGGATATDNCGPITITRSPSGNTFGVGTTTITWTATDGAGNNMTATQAITVIDNTPPVITTNGTVPSMWPPNHKYQTFQVTNFVSSVFDNCGGIGVSDVVIESVTSDEAENGTGSG